MTPRQRIQTAVLGSLLVHGFVGLVLPGAEPTPSTRPPEAFLVPFQPAVPDEHGQTTSASQVERPLPGGPTSRSTLDTRAAPGRGGFGAAPEDGVLLFSFLAQQNLQDSDLNQLAAAQTQRIRTSEFRRTLEQRRATPHPQDAASLTTGKAGHVERRQPSERDPAWGAPQGQREPTTGALDALRSRPTSAGVGAAAATATAPPTQGIDRGRGELPSERARQSTTRPNVDRGPAATPAEQIAPRVSDNRDAELLAARLERSLVDSSLQRSRARGNQLGGSALDGPGLEELGQSQGARARPYLPGEGTLGVLDTRDGRYVHWFTHQRARVQDGLEFPVARALAKDQGVSLFRVEVRRDGSLEGPPRLLRSSGFADFDSAAAAAILRALPFEPLPQNLAPEHARLSLVLPVAFENPMVE